MSSTPPPPGLNALASAATSRSSASSRTSLLLAQTDSDEDFENDFEKDFVDNGATAAPAAAASTGNDNDVEVLDDPVLSATLVDVELAGAGEELLRVAKKGKELTKIKSIVGKPMVSISRATLGIFCTANRVHNRGFTKFQMCEEIVAVIEGRSERIEVSKPKAKTKIKKEEQGVTVNRFRLMNVLFSDTVRPNLHELQFQNSTICARIMPDLSFIL
jgi:hypothetical protein